ncbi:zinc finger protein 214-like [Bradysia coprophila]|uniref:zinc finger protein 214-like n=1 Tax=Bradysia coprophila TaxID=38358 RepID=UPI00187DBA39|nr:zinc finger protein 214-like [Bradysia coprophila]
MFSPTQCRMCLIEYGDAGLESMLVSWNDSMNLWTMYDYIMNVGEMFDLVNVPHICKKCKEDLVSAYTFKVMCTETEKTLTGIVAICQTDKVPKTEYVVYDSEDNVVKYADNYLGDNIEICEEIEGDEDVFDDNEEVCKDNSIEGIVETNDVEFQDRSDNQTDKRYARVETVQEIDGQRITSKVFSRKCKKCNIKFESLHEYTVHYRQLHQRAYNRKLHKSNARNCPSCNIQFENVKLYQVHYRRFHKRQQADKDAQSSSKQSRVVCSYCGQLFSKSFIVKHIRSKHSGEENRRYECTTCGKRFTLCENLVMHKRIHSNDKRFECDVCGEKFLHWASRRNHIRSKHTGGEKNYECHLCGQKFAHSGSLHQHMQRHRNELPHSCSTCAKGFVTKEELKNHQIVHTKVKNEVCDVCSKCFGTRKNLRAHLKIHSERERKYVCTVCDKRFAQAHVLRTHLKTHPSAEMPENVTLLENALG